MAARPQAEVRCVGSQRRAQYYLVLSLSNTVSNMRREGTRNPFLAVYLIESSIQLALVGHEVVLTKGCIPLASSANSAIGL